MNLIQGHYLLCKIIFKKHKLCIEFLSQTKNQNYKKIIRKTTTCMQPIRNGCVNDFTVATSACRVLN